MSSNRGEHQKKIGAFGTSHRKNDRELFDSVWDLNTDHYRVGTVGAKTVRSTCGQPQGHAVIVYYFLWPEESVFLSIIQRI